MSMDTHHPLSAADAPLVFWAVFAAGFGLLYVSDGPGLWIMPPLPAELRRYKEAIDAPAPKPFPFWLLFWAVLLAAVLAVRYASELRGLSYRRRR